MTDERTENQFHFLSIIYLLLIVQYLLFAKSQEICILKLIKDTNQRSPSAYIAISLPFFIGETADGYSFPCHYNPVLLDDMIAHERSNLQYPDWL